MGIFGWLFGGNKKQAEETPQESLSSSEQKKEAAWAEFAKTSETKPESNPAAEPTAMPEVNAQKTTELLLMKLKARYPKGSKLSAWPKWTEKLRNDNEYELCDLMLKALDVCKEEQGMDLEEYLEQNGMMLRIWPGDYDMLYKLIERYKGNPFCGNAKEFRDANKDIKWASIKRIADARASGFPVLYLEIYTPIFKRDETPQKPEELPPGERDKFYEFLEKMKEAFPDRQIELQPGVYTEWSEGIREFCYGMHYPNIKTFLAAYGYTLVGAEDNASPQNLNTEADATVKSTKGDVVPNGRVGQSNASTAKTDVKMQPLMYADESKHFYSRQEGRAKFIPIPPLFNSSVVKRENNATLTNVYELFYLTRKQEVLGSVQVGEPLSLVREAFAKGGFDAIAVYTYRGQFLGMIMDEGLAYYIDTEYVDVSSVKAVEIDLGGSRTVTKRVRNALVNVTATYDVGSKTESVSFKVSGVNFYPEGVDTLEKGCELTFRREPENPYSANAIAICGPTGEIAGHVPEALASQWAPMIDSGKMTGLHGTAEEVKKAGTKTVTEDHPACLRVEIVFTYDDTLVVASNLTKDLEIITPHAKLLVEGVNGATTGAYCPPCLFAYYKDSIGDILLALADRKFYQEEVTSYKGVKEKKYRVAIDVDKDLCNLFKRERLVSVSEEAKNDARLYRIECNDMLEMMREQTIYMQCSTSDKFFTDCVASEGFSMVELPESDTPYIAHNLNWYLLSIGKQPVTVPFAVPKAAAAVFEPQQPNPKPTPANKPNAKKRTAPITITGMPVKINDDFSILVPNGMRWSTDEAENDDRLLVVIKNSCNKFYKEWAGKDPVEYDFYMPFAAPQCLTLKKGIDFSDVLGTDADFSDSNIHNLVLKMSEEVLGKTLTDDIDADVVYVRDDGQIVSSYMRCKDNNTMFLIATPKAVYQGQIFINDTEDASERHELIEAWLGSIRRGVEDRPDIKPDDAFAMPTYQQGQHAVLGEMSVPVPDGMFVWSDSDSEQNLSKADKEQLTDAALVIIPKGFDKGFNGYKDAPFSVRFSRSGIQQVNGADSLWLLPENMRQKYLTNILDQNLQNMDVIQDYKIKFKELETELDVVYSQVGEGPDWCSYVVCFLCKNVFYQAMIYINNKKKNKVAFRKAVEQWIFSVSLM